MNLFFSKKLWQRSFNLICFLAISLCFGCEADGDYSLSIQKRKTVAIDLLRTYLPQTLDSVTWSDPSPINQPHKKDERIELINSVVTEFHQELVHIHPSYKSVPMPYFVTSFNYFASSRNAQVDPDCRNYDLPIPIVFGKSRGNLDHEVRPVLFNIDGEPGLGFKRDCNETVNVDLDNLAAILDANHFQSGCRLLVDESKSYIYFGDGCNIGSYIKANNYTHSTTLILEYTKRSIFIGRDILEEEQHMWMTVFHELAHYYLGHVALRGNASGWHHYFSAKKRIPFTIPPTLTKSDLAKADPSFELEYLYHYYRVFADRLDDSKAWEGVKLTTEQAIRNMNITLSEQISRYSYETIADEFGLLARQIMGKTSDEADNFRSLEPMFWGKESNPDNPYIYGLEKCRSILGQGEISDFTKIYVPFGNFIDIHPSPCHRLYNLMVHRHYLRSIK